MKRLICFLLAGLMLLPLTACGDTGASGGSAATTAGAETSAAADETDAETELTDGLPDTDLGGFTLRFYNYDDSWLTWSINILCSEEQDGETVNDAVYLRNRRIEERFNAAITEEAVPNAAQNLTGLVLAGEDFADVVMLYDETTTSHYASGELLSWNNIPYVDFTNPWWNQDAADVFKICGTQVAAVGAFSLSMYGRGFVMLLNKDMYKDFGDADIYGMVSDGGWTYDVFRDIAVEAIADLDGSGTMDANDRYGIMGALKQVQGSFVTGGGVKYITTDADGVPVFNIPGNEKAQNVLRKVYEIFSQQYLYYNPVSNIHDGGTPSGELFRNGQSLFIGTSIRGITNYRNMDDDIGILPFPKYSETDDGYAILTSGGTLATLPVTLSSERFEAVGLLMEALSFDSYYNLLKEYRETVLKTKYSRDEESAAMLDIIFDSGVFDLGLSIWPNDTYYPYMEKVYFKNEDVIASLTESLSAKVAGDIESFLASMSSAQ